MLRDTRAPQAALDEALAGWRLPPGPELLTRVEEMIRPALRAGCFGMSHTRVVAGLQYHLGGERDTRELAQLAGLRADDRVLDVCCFIGGPALQLAHEVGCRVTGVDIKADLPRAARRLAQVAGLTPRLAYAAADAGRLPFADGSFTVVWSQCSLAHSDAWLAEFTRVLAPDGRLALTLQIETSPKGERWTLVDLAERVERLGYRVDHAQDISTRDVEIGWRALVRRLDEQRAELAAALGRDWVEQARAEFQGEAEAMLRGDWGNGRLVATRGG